MTNPLLPGGIVQRSARLPLVQTGGKKMPRGTELPLHSRACVDFEAFPQWRTDCLLAAREASDGAIPNRMAQTDREAHRVERRHAGWSCRTTGTIYGSAQRAAEAGVLQHRQCGHAGVSHPGSRLRSGDAQRRGGPPCAVDAPGLAVKNDGNNVSLDRESRLLAENALRFQVASGLMRTQIQVLRSAIEGGQNG